MAISSNFLSPTTACSCAWLSCSSCDGASATRRARSAKSSVSAQQIASMRSGMSPLASMRLTLVGWQDLCALFFYRSPLSPHTFPHFSPHCRRPPSLPRAEAGLLLGAVALLAVAWFGPAQPASVHQHDFADLRTLWGIPCAMDVLSNLPFAFAGLYGLVVLRRVGPAMPDAASRASATLFFAGLLCTAAGSAVYHWQPQDAGLLWDRLGTVLPFAGLLGLTAANRVSERSGWAVAAAVLLAGPLALLWWSYRGNLLPWAVVQFGGMSVVLVLAFVPRRAGALALYPGAVI